MTRSQTFNRFEVRLIGRMPLGLSLPEPFGMPIRCTIFWHMGTLFASNESFPNFVRLGIIVFWMFLIISLLTPLESLDFEGFNPISGKVWN